MQRFLESCVRQRHPAQVRDALPLDQLPVFVQALLDLITIELLGHALAALLEAPHIIGRPPIFYITLRVELGALVIETVRYFVPDDGADAAVVAGVVALGVVVRRLPDGRGQRAFLAL